MIELTLGVWSASAALLFLPVRPVARLVARWLRPAAGSAAKEAELTASPATTAVENVPAAPDLAVPANEPQLPAGASDKEALSSTVNHQNAGLLATEEEPAGLPAAPDEVAGFPPREPAPLVQLERLVAPPSPYVRRIWRTSGSAAEEPEQAESPATANVESVPGALDSAALASEPQELPTAGEEALSSAANPEGASMSATEEAPADLSAVPQEVSVLSSPQPALLARLWRLVATLALYAVFITTSVYLTPRLLATILGTEHPIAAITSQSMYPVLQRGDLVLLEGVDQPADLRVGDIIAFKSENGFAIHRVIKIDGFSIATKGDANQVEDGPITFDQVIGRALRIRGHIARVPYLGDIPMVFERTSQLDNQQGGSSPTFDRGSNDNGTSGLQ